MEESITKWMQEWFNVSTKKRNKNDNEWTYIEGVGNFKNLKIISDTEEYIDDLNLNITLKYDKFDVKNRNESGLKD